MTKKKLAWLATEGDEGHGTIVFHHHGLAARRLGASELGCEEESVECKRAPEYDQYAEKGSIPKKILLENGWWFECDGCYTVIQLEQVDVDAKETPLEELVVVGDFLYCNPSCRELRVKEISDQNDRFEQFKVSVLKERPDLEFTEFDGAWPSITMTAKFSFPGSQFGGGTIRSDKGKLSTLIANGDLAAWEKFKQGDAL